MFLLQRLAAMEVMLVMLSPRFDICFFRHHSLFNRAGQSLGLGLEKSKLAIVVRLCF